MAKDKNLEASIDPRQEVFLEVEGKPAVTGMDFLYYRINHKDEFKPVMVPAPNYTALFLSISDKGFKIASDLYNDKIKTSITDKGKYFELDCKDASEVLFDFMEATFISIVFAYSAVECLINSLVPNYIILIGKNNQETYEFKSKNFLERYIGLDDKIKKILPRVYGYGFNAGQSKFWSNFKKLEYYRNEIIHMKSQELDGSKSTQTKIVSQLFVDTIILDIIESARKLIKYLNEKISHVPGFPREFKSDDMKVEKYIQHFRSKKIDTGKKLIINFPSEKVLRKFIEENDMKLNEEIKIIVK